MLHILQFAILTRNKNNEIVEHQILQFLSDDYKPDVFNTLKMCTQIDFIGICKI